MATRTAICLLLIGCALSALPAHAQFFPWSPKDDDGEKVWIEAETRRPPYPKPENLIQYDPGVKSANRYYIDPQSISIGSDEVVRYTRIIKSSGGAENVSYEGQRCLTREHKYYAHGRPDRTWSEARSSAWRRIDKSESSRMLMVLYTDYFCPTERYPVTSVKEAVNLLKKGGPAPFAPRDD